jgi:serine/threonine-protein kinase
MPKLLIEKGPNKGETFTLTSQFRTVLIGRESSAHLKLTDTMTSRLHFKVESRTDGFYLLDMESMNGTFVNGKRVTEKLLKMGDMIQIGETLISFIGDKLDRKDDRADEIIGGYKIIERIGRGGMGTVYKATQISLNRIVALKLLSEEMVKDKNFINLFVEEARSAAQLNNPNIVQVYDVGRTANEVYYFSMEYLPGGSVQELLAKDKKLAPARAAKIVLDAAKGLEYAEKKAIVHRDIKPDNLMVAEDGSIKICDLGLAKSLKTPSKSELEGGILGTPHYLAPEQAQGKSVDHRADIYALGATFYRLIAGVTPYSGSSVKEIILKKLKEEPVPLKDAAADAPAAVVTIVEKMMKRSVEDRYQSATQIITDVSNLISDLESPEGKKISPKAAKPASKGTPIAIAVGLIIVLAVLGLIFKDKIFPPPPVIKPNGQVNQDYNTAEEKLAAQYFKEADTFEKTQMNANDAASIKHAISLYERIPKECPKSAKVVEAEAGVARLKEAINQLGIRREQEKYWKDAQDAFDLVNDFITENHSRLIKTGSVAEVPNFIEQFLAELAQIEEKYPGTPAADSAAKKKVELEPWYDRFNQAAEAFEKTEKEVKEQVENEQFRRAYKAIESFAKNPAYKDTGYDTRVNDLSQTVDKAAGKAFDYLMKRVDNLIEEKKYAEAKKLLTSAANSFGHPKLEKQIQDKIESVDRLQDLADEELKERGAKQDEEKFQPMVIPLLWNLHTGQFKNINMQAPDALFVTKDYQEKWREVIEQITLEKNILTEFMERVNTNRMPNRLHKEKYLMSVDERGIVASINEKPGTNFRTLKWEDLSATEWYSLLRNGWDLSKKNKIELGVLCMRRGGLFAEAGVCFTAVINDPDVGALADKYQQLLKDEKKRWEKEAKQIFQQGDSWRTNNKKPEALVAFNLLKSRYSDTRYYEKNETDIKKYIIECRKP